MNQELTSEYLDQLRKENPNRYYHLLGRGDFIRVYKGPKADIVFNEKEMEIAMAVNEVVRDNIRHSSYPSTIKKGMLMCATVDELAGDDFMRELIKSKAREE